MLSLSHSSDDDGSGLGLFYGGMVRKKNVGDTVMTSFCGHVLVTILFAVLTYSLAFRTGTPSSAAWIARSSRTSEDIGKGGIGIPIRSLRPFRNRVYLLSDDVCHHHAGADRRRVCRAMKFSAMLWFIGLWAVFVYAPIAHWVWGLTVPVGRNEAAYVKVLDFAGGTVVHINAGVAG